MLSIDLPTRSDLLALCAERGAPCVSIYLRTTPIGSSVQTSRIELKNLLGEAVRQLQAVDTPKRSIWPIEAAVAEIEGDDEFWAHQANSLALFLTPDRMRSFRLPNNIRSHVHVADRFHLKPLMRSVTFPQEAYILAIGRGAVRLVEVSPDLPPTVVQVPGLPRDMSDALNRRIHKERTGGGTSGESADEGALLRRYARVVDESLRPFLSGHERPLVIAATEPLAPVFLSVSTYPHILSETIKGGPEQTPDHVLAGKVRDILDGVYAGQMKHLAMVWTERASQGRATGDIAQAARAATVGAIDTLVVDMDETVPGTVDEDGAVTFAEADDAVTYGVVDEIARRALLSGARIVSARRADIPGGGSLAAILRYAV